MFFFFNDTATTEIYTLSLHDALPIYVLAHGEIRATVPQVCGRCLEPRSEEHTSELQSQSNLVCRLLLEKKKKKKKNQIVGYTRRYTCSIVPRTPTHVTSTHSSAVNEN